MFAVLLHNKRACIVGLYVSKLPKPNNTSPLLSESANPHTPLRSAQTLKNVSSLLMVLRKRVIFTDLLCKEDRRQSGADGSEIFTFHPKPLLWQRRGFSNGIKVLFICLFLFSNSVNKNYDCSCGVAELPTQQRYIILRLLDLLYVVILKFHTDTNTIE